MKRVLSILLLILIRQSLFAQDLLYSEKTIVSMWNENISDWIPIIERNDTVTFTLTQDRSMLLMYCRGSGLHFKYLYVKNGQEMAWYSQDTTFYKIISSEVKRDINDNTIIKLITLSGIRNKEYVFNYYKKENLLHCIFDNNAGRIVRNRFVIKSGTIK